MDEIMNLPYAGWLEEAIATLAACGAKSIALAAQVENNTVFTAYFNADMTDKIILSENIRMDAVFEMAKANARAIVEAAEEADEGEE